MRKPSVYLDTNIFSALHTDSSFEVLILRRIATREWWQLERKNFALCTSKLTETELSKGRYRGQSDAIAEVKRMPYLHSKLQVRNLARELIDSNIVPKEELADALHLAFALHYRLDYLLTWNQAHLSNIVVIEKLEFFSSKMGHVAPLILSPERIPWVSRGEPIRRRS